MKRKYLDYVEGMLSEVNYLIKRAQSLTFEDFILNEDLNRAFKIPWKEIAGIRDKLIHDYFCLN